ncbi:hypothetical protein O181_062046 [Austropuccinia psidii MF-1]|uniref:Uncharacterized protein n=1 Tax=Austropuccinia psidii MF-1 TaxID=1389203 RepID=A0A9Q3EHA7_9BASI|nr:hypothetical protein [Austropuccinia psidii MF-1]
MSPVHPRNLGIPRNQQEDREGWSRTRRPGGGNLAHSGGWQTNEGDNIHLSIHTKFQQEPQTRGLEGYGSSSSAPPAPQSSFPMELGQQEVQPSIPMDRTWRKLPEDMSQRDNLQRPYGNHQKSESHEALQTPGGEGKQDKGESSHYPCYRRTPDPDRAYSDSFKLTSSRPSQLSSSLTHSGTNRSVAKSQHSSQSQEVSRRRQGYKGKKQDLLQPKAERVRPNDPEAV